MNRLRGANLDLLKRVPVLISIGVVIVVILGWYLFWWSPENSKLSTIDNQVAGLQADYINKTQQLAQINADLAAISKDRNYLSRFAVALPPTADQGQLTQDFFNIQEVTNVTITSLNDSTPQAPAPGSLLGTLPVSMTVTGAHDAVIQFLKDIYASQPNGSVPALMPRLVTIQSVTPTPIGPGNVLAHNAAQFSISISATAYFAPSATGSPAAS
jgi:Tfp pilus assembly protein PilO